MERPSLADAWRLPPMELLVAGLADLGDLSGEPEAGAVVVTALALETALELDLAIDDDGAVTAVGASTPTQWTETTIMPAFHTLRVRLARSDRG